jgi:predicted cation transporter
MIAVILTSLAILAVLLGAILVKPIERNVEFFFLVAGTITSAVMGQFSSALIRTALHEPIALTSADDAARDSTAAVFHVSSMSRDGNRNWQMGLQ